MLRYLFSVFFIVLTFSACQLTDSSQELAKKQAAQQKAFEAKVANTKEVQLQKIEAQKAAQLAQIRAQTQLAEVEKEKRLEEIKLKAHAQKEALLLQQQKEREAFEAKLREIEHADDMEIKRYLLLILLVVLIIASYFVYLYFKQRHQDKLRAYEDNLEKYFHQQENMTKMRIAEKIIDRVATGELDKEQEIALLSALGGNMRVENQQHSLENKKQNDVTDAELIEEKK
jgi:hypothetical protein